MTGRRAHVQGARRGCSARMRQKDRARERVHGGALQAWIVHGGDETRHDVTGLGLCNDHAGEMRIG